MSDTKDISKVTLLKIKDGYGLKVVFRETDKFGAPSNDDKETRGLIHPDLKAAMDALAVHWGLLSGVVRMKEIEDIALPQHELLEKIHVNGYSIGGDVEQNTQGVILSGHYITWRAKGQSLNTAFERFEGSPEALYCYIDDLQAKLTVIEEEVQKYLNGKRGTKPAAETKTADAKDQRQVTMDFNKEEPITKMVIAEPDPNLKVTPEGNLVAEKDKYKFANKDAMDRVAEDDTKGKKKGGGKKGTGKGQVQTPDNPSGSEPGETEEAVE